MKVGRWRKASAFIYSRSESEVQMHVLLNEPGSVAPFLLIDHIKQKCALRTAEESAHTAV